MKNDLIIVLTARCGSERFPRKVVQLVKDKPLIVWIAERLKAVDNSVVIIATTSNKEDDELEDIAKTYDVICYRHDDPNDVVGRVTAVFDMFPKAHYVMRALGDCPFIDPTIVKRARDCLEIYNSDAFCWMQPPETLPVYGAREFPYSRHAWNMIDMGSKGEEREHTDMWYNNHRETVRIVYHEPPSSSYFRTYRLEVDYPEDLEMVRAVANDIGMLASIPDVNRFLDNHPEIVNINKNRHEKTGPIISHDYAIRRKWFKQMVGKPVVDWDDRVWYAPTSGSTPIFCNNNLCLIGYGSSGKLYTKEGHIIEGKARITCRCGAGRMWKQPIKSRY